MGEHRPFVSLRPMMAEEWEAWRAESIRGYAEEKVVAGTWTAETATQRAEDEFAGLLPDGQGTAGHEFRAIVTEADESVGVVWLGAQRDIGRGAAFIYDIVVEADQRGRGYGRAAMEALEPLARSLGYDRIQLHVFGHNAIARSLYASLGYIETDVQMEKRVD